MDHATIRTARLTKSDGAMKGKPSSEPELRFYIFGNNISHSLSPTLHNSGFEELDLPYHYSIIESPDVDKTVERLISRSDFGGASVTYPHKLQIGRLVDSVSACSAKVGAINTIVVERGGANGGGRRLRGDNTDWLGILRCIRKCRHQDLEKLPALVLGAGGAARAACHALQTLGVFDITIVNRTKETAEVVAKHFPEFKTIHIYQTLHEACVAYERPYGIIIACVPAIYVDESHIPELLFSPRGMDKHGGLLIEMAYKPHVTNMMKAVSRHPGWDVFGGTDVLEEQAYAQFEMWTGMEAPTEVMGRSMRAAMQAQENES